MIKKIWNKIKYYVLTFCISVLTFIYISYLSTKKKSSDLDKKIDDIQKRGKKWLEDYKDLYLD